MFTYPEIAKRLLSNGTLNVDFPDLIGEFILTGVDKNNTLIKNYYSSDMENSQVFSFILNGITYSAVENPEDGYRSSLRYFIIESYLVKNTFKPVKVYAKYIEKYNDYNCDIIEMYCKKNNKVILRTGTDNVDDYYPVFVSEWIPENLV